MDGHTHTDDPTWAAPPALACWLSHGGDRGLIPFAATAAAVLVLTESEFLSLLWGYVAISRPEENPRAITLYNSITACRIPLSAISFFKRWHDVATVVLSTDPTRRRSGPPSSSATRQTPRLL
uniref:Uncharacterized protein n=1 Tax=Leersia perrieri TaxID=77586 RepID=A0A0D9XLM1_9ORYZ